MSGNKTSRFFKFSTDKELEPEIPEDLAGKEILEGEETSDVQQTEEAHKIEYEPLPFERGEKIKYLK